LNFRAGDTSTVPHHHHLSLRQLSQSQQQNDSIISSCFCCRSVSPSILDPNPHFLLSFSLGGNITKFIGARHPDFIHKKHPDFGKKENPDLEWYIDRAVNGTLEATGVSAEQVQKAWIGNFAAELFSSQVCEKSP
jgi:hypothetical protein